MASRYLLAAPLLLLTACQQSSPAATPAQAPDLRPETQIAPAAITGQAPLMAAQVRFDPATGNAELTPLRAASAGLQDVLEVVDITQYFTNAPCNSCLKIVGVGTSAAGNPTLQISVRHPFASPAPGLQMRQDLAVFNVEGVVRFQETGQTVQTFPGLNVAAVTSTRLVNADGLTGSLDGAYDADYRVTAANVHPYRLFFRDYSNGTFDPGNEQGFPDYSDIRGFLAMGQGKGPDVQTFEFAMPTKGSLIEFDLVLQASFGVASANIAERATPEYRLPQYNKKAASEVRVGVSDVMPGNLSGRGLLSQITSSAAQIRIQVLDITDASTGVTVGTERGQLRAASDVATLQVDIPDVITSMITVNDPATLFEGGTGNSPLAPLTYSLGISNQESAVDGTYFGMLRVGDSYPLDSNTVLPEDGQRFSTPGFTEPFAISEFATYQLFPVEVKPNVIARLADGAVGDAVGTSLAYGDFNADGLLDLAVGAFEADPGGTSNAGRVLAYYQFPNGFVPVPLTLQEAAPAVNVRLGFSVAVGDITGDGRDDIIASATNPNIPGRVAVFRSQGTSFLPGVTVTDSFLPAGSRYGWALAVGDVNDDGRDDVYIGAPQALGSFIGEGVVYRYFGTPSGLSSPLTINAPAPALDTQFGSSLALLRSPAGEATELAVGMPGHNAGTGRVYVFPITSIGGVGTPAAVNPLTGNPQDAFGYSLEATDLTADGRDDLIVGAPGSATSMAGRVEVLRQDNPAAFTTVSRLTVTGSDTYSFGSTVSFGDFDGDGVTDVVGGGLLLEASGIAQGGRVAVFPGGRELSGNVLEFHAPNASIDQFFGRSVLGLPRPGQADLLLVGCMADDPGGNTNAGSVYVY